MIMSIIFEFAVFNELRIDILIMNLYTFWPNLITKLLCSTPYDDIRI